MSTTGYDSESTAGMRMNNYVSSKGDQPAQLHDPEIEAILSGHAPGFRKRAGESKSVKTLDGGDTPLRKRRGGFYAFKGVGKLPRRKRR